MLEPRARTGHTVIVSVLANTKKRTWTCGGDGDSDNDHSSSQLSVRKALTCPESHSAWALAHFPFEGDGQVHHKERSTRPSRDVSGPLTTVPGSFSVPV